MICRRMWVSINVLVTLTFDLLTLKLVCERVASKVGNLHSRFLGTLAGLWVLELFAMYATDGRTKANLTASPSY